MTECDSSNIMNKDDANGLDEKIDRRIDEISRALDYDMKMIPIRMVAVRIIRTHKKLIRDTLMDCVQNGVFGRNQEETVTDAVMAQIREDIKGMSMTKSTLEDIEFYIDEYVSTMRVYPKSDDDCGVDMSDTMGDCS